MTNRRGISLLTAAILLSALGDFLAVIPLALHLQHDSGSGLVVAGLFIALWTPVALLAAPAGLLVDRFDPRRTLIAVSLAQAVSPRASPSPARPSRSSRSPRCWAAASPLPTRPSSRSCRRSPARRG